MLYIYFLFYILFYSHNKTNKQKGVILVGTQDKVVDEFYGNIEYPIEKSGNRTSSQYNKKRIDYNHPIKKETKPIEKQKSIKLSNLTSKELSSAKQNLNNLKNKLLKSPIQYKNQLEKLNKLEKKIDHELVKRREKDNQNSINLLQRNPKYYTVQIFDTMNKLQKVKSNLEHNPQQYKNQLAKLNLLQKRLDQQLSRMKNNQLDKAINIMHKNSGKYKEVLKKFKIIEKKLERQIKNSQHHAKNNKKQQQKEKPKVRDISISR